MNRHPLHPLLAFIGPVYTRFATHNGTATWERVVDARCSILAEKCGVSRRQVQRWAQTGLSDWQADRAAIACGAHPMTIWPTWLSDARIAELVEATP